MIQAESKLRVADNTGARTIQCIRIMGRSTRRTAGVGDVIVASVRTAIPNAAVKPAEANTQTMMKVTTAQARSPCAVSRKNTSSL